MLKCLVSGRRKYRSCQKCVDAIHNAGGDRLHFVLIDAGYVVPRNFPAFSINDFDIGIITNARDGGDAGMELLQEAPTNTGRRHELGKFAL